MTTDPYVLRKIYVLEQDAELMGLIYAILIDRARSKLTRKRGGGLQRQPLEAIPEQKADEELLALDEALSKLSTEDPEKARLVELRFFAGLTGEEAAQVLGISPSTADRHWAYARAWLQNEVRGH